MILKPIKYGYIVSEISAEKNFASKGLWPLKKYCEFHINLDSSFKNVVLIVES